MNRIGKKRIVIISAIVLVVLLALIFILVYRRGIRATTMRLLRYEGTVTMEENGTSKSVKENLRLRSGNSLDTAVSSLVSIGLDDTKIVTMDELSRSEFNQKGKYLNLNLTKGSIVNTGSGQSSIDAFKEAYEDVMSQTGSTPQVIGVNFGYGEYRDNGSAVPNSFAVAYQNNTTLIGSIEFSNTSIDWNASSGPRITADNAHDYVGNQYSYTIDGTITGNGFINN